MKSIARSHAIAIIAACTIAALSCGKESSDSSESSPEQKDCTATQSCTSNTPPGDVSSKSCSEADKGKWVVDGSQAKRCVDNPDKYDLLKCKTGFAATLVNDGNDVHCIDANQNFSFAYDLDFGTYRPHWCPADRRYKWNGYAIKNGKRVFVRCDTGSFPDFVGGDTADNGYEDNDRNMWLQCPTGFTEKIVNDDNDAHCVDQEGVKTFEYDTNIGSYKPNWCPQADRGKWTGYAWKKGRKVFVRCDTGAYPDYLGNDTADSGYDDSDKNMWLACPEGFTPTPVNDRNDVHCVNRDNIKTFEYDTIAGSYLPNWCPQADRNKWTGFAIKKGTKVYVRCDSGSYPKFYGTNTADSGFHDSDKNMWLKCEEGANYVVSSNGYDVSCEVNSAQSCTYDTDIGSYKPFGCP